MHRRDDASTAGAGLWVRPELLVASCAGTAGTLAPGLFLTDAIDPTAPAPQRHRPNGMKQQTGLYLSKMSWPHDRGTA